ncbi:MAG: YjdF family protein [Anaerostipes sp.]|nr:YjdF family protein [Anaerostipes sp.]MDD3746791.1 YjdF family protein [Anaerostipes sp.]
MNKVTYCRLIVFFEAPFWVGMIEREFQGKLSVAKITFGAEPKDYEVLEWLKGNYNNLRFSPTTSLTKKRKEHMNPKRLQREARKQTSQEGIGTKSQQALKLLQEQGKLQRRSKTKMQRELEKKRQFQLHQKKRKEKHRGH